MKVMKPTWVTHDGLPIFAIDIHPDGTRFATGGQGNNTGGRVSIWNIFPVLDRSKSEDENVPKLLCELEFHACVNAVRWSHSGMYLSSAGDDRAVEIWKCSSKYSGSSVAPSSNPFAKASHEQWRSVATLNGHQGDILDISWSACDKYLASASVDNNVIIWDALNFPQILTTLKGHTSLVKGVTWDPIGKFVASQSDDRTLRIWRTSDWQQEQVVKEPFVECGGTTHALRLDWSPDGMYLVSAHAMNAGGPTAQIVERTGWKTDKDFVGHRKAVQCVRFTRSLMQSPINKSKSCFVALGSRDRCVSVWSAALKRPLVVVRDLFKNSVMDITWSTCGRILAFCSFDGTVGFTEFAVSEIGKPISSNELASLHQQTYGNNIISSSFNLVQDVTVLKGQMKSKKVAAAATEKPTTTTTKSETNGTDIQTSSKPSLSPSPVPATATPTKVSDDPPKGEQSDSSTTSPARGPLYKQIETVRNDGKRRITPQFLLPQDGSQSKLEDSNNQTQSSNPSVFKSDSKEVKLDAGAEKKPEDEKRDAAVTDKAALLEARVTDGGSGITENKIGEPASISKPRTSSSGSNEAPAKTSTQDPSKPSVIPAALIKRKRSTDDPADPKAAKRGKAASGVSSSPGTSAKVISHQTPKGKDKMGSSFTSTREGGAHEGRGGSPMKFIRTKLTPIKLEQNTLQVVVKRTGGYNLLIENYKKVGRYTSHSITCQHEKDSLEGLSWTVCVESPICGVTGDSFRVVVLCEDTTCHVLDIKGRYCLPPIVLPNMPHSVTLREQYLMIITTKATLHMWNVHLKKNVIRSESLLPLLHQSSGDTGGRPVEISRSTILIGGVPLIILSNGKWYKFSSEMQSWMLYVNVGPSLADLNDKTLSEAANCQVAMWSGGSARSVNYAAISEAKLKLASAIELKKNLDIKACMHGLGVILAREGLEQELRHLLLDLLGPCHSGSNSNTSTGAGGSSGSMWNSMVVGVPKREILRAILNSILKDLRWQDMYCEFSELLDHAESSGANSSEMELS